MIRAVVRALVRGVAVLVVVVAVVAAVTLYRSGKFPYQQEIGDASVVGSAKAAYALHRQLSERVIRVEAHRGRLVLSGEVASETEKEEAETIARNLEGVAEVQNLLTIDAGVETAGESIRSLGETLDDVALLAKIRAALALDREAKALDLDIVVRDGGVALRGEVSSEKLKKRVLRRVASIGGVVDVEDGMVVAE